MAVMIVDINDGAAQVTDDTADRRNTKYHRPPPAQLPGEDHGQEGEGQQDDEDGQQADEDDRPDEEQRQPQSEVMFRVFYPEF